MVFDVLVFWFSGGVRMVFWCSSSVLVFWCSVGVLVFWFSGGVLGGLKKYTSLACLEFKLLLEVLLDLLQPIQAVLSLQVNLRLLEMVSNDSPYPNTWKGAQN